MTSDEDVIVWALNKGGVYSTKSVYKFVSSGGVVSRRMLEVYVSVGGGGAKILLKVKIFPCQVFNDKLQSVEQLKKREWKEEIKCVLCGMVEDVDHIMFMCVLSRCVWSKMKEIFGWSHFPRFREDFVILCSCVY
jgi:hypothetical protein